MATTTTSWSPAHRQSLDRNRELGIVTEDPEIVVAAGRTFEGDFAGER